MELFNPFVVFCWKDVKVAAMDKSVGGNFSKLSFMTQLELVNVAVVWLEFPSSREARLTFDLVVMALLKYTKRYLIDE